ncbi:unnamed protein product [Clonostachys rhizophaga]|uniref:Uncharacterized protein n=1 Tax=Clonostachys rhizophaga TaxID=160324 RepID=A0A9N9V549_9HYPO|nr:unnamed protein product [Clonostachys rhizophaga]
MTPLASIPEVSHSNLDSRTNQSRQPRVSSFERARRRSRVLIISRHPSRPQRRVVSPQSTAQQNQNSKFSGKDTSAPSYSGNRAAEISVPKPDGSSVQGRVTTADIPESGSPSQSISAQSDGTIDIDSFPLPPSHNNNPCPLQFSVHDGATKTSQIYKSTNDPSSARVLLRQQVYNRKLPSKNPSINTGSYGHSPSSITAKGVASPRSPRRSHVDTDLVDIITKSVAEQIGAISQANSPKNLNRPGDSSRNVQDNASRSPSQVRALDTFTKELQRYAEIVGAAGKSPTFTPTPSKSSATLRTVSALLPFRSEFNAAGLAVTSKDQRHQDAQASTKVKAAGHRPRARHRGAVNSKRFRGLQVDGKVNSLSEPTTAVDFTSPTNTDVWRRSLIDRLPPRRNVLFPYRPRSRRSCLPCLPKRRVRLNSKKSSHRSVKIPPGYVRRLSQQPKPRHSSESRDVISQVPSSHYSQKDGHSSSIYLETDDSDEPTIRVPKANTLNAVLGLRRKRKTIASPRLLRQRKYKPPREPQEIQLFPHDYAAYKSSMDASNSDQVSCRPGNGSLRESQRQKDHVPHNQSQQTRVDYDAMSIPELPPLRRHLAGKAAQAYSLRDVFSDRLTAKAVRELSRQDPGRYPVQLPPHLRTTFSSPKPPDIPCRVSSRRCQTTTSESSSGTAQVNDRVVLKGLHIAAAAACDESVHTTVHKNTGLNVRRFLSELMALSALGQDQPAEDKEKQVKRRRAKIRKLKQQVRASRKRMQEGSDVI